ncbi:MAG: rhomboid family intramembrane serine protease [Bacteroidia bacterium]|nr:rhomboid family intramembrane serine protease [Bacteroidia bacterium]
MSETEHNLEKQNLIGALLLSGSLVLVLWIVFGVESAFGLDFSHFGILPRKLTGLTGILTGPLVHGDWKHLLFNSGPLFVLLTGLIFFYRKVAFRAFSWIYLMTGLWVWVGARTSYHIGISGVIYGLAAFLLFSGVFRKDLRSLALSFVVVVLYGGMVSGIFPSIKTEVSWESHLFGALAGLAVAFALRKIGRVPRKKYSWEDEPEYDPRDETAPWNYHETYFEPRVHPEDQPSDATPEIRYTIPPPDRGEEV